MAGNQQDADTGNPCLPFGNLLKIVLLNARSVCNKTIQLTEFAAAQSIDAMAITETWLTDTPADSAILAELSSAEFYMHHVPRSSGGRGGGVGLLCNDSLRLAPCTQSKFQTFDYMERLVTCTPKVYIVVIYRPPTSSSSKFGEFISEFTELMEGLILRSEHLIIMGDFNIHVDQPNDRQNIAFLNVTESFGLLQLVKERTHRGGHTLDLVLIRGDDAKTIQPVVSVEDHNLSDHSAVFLTIQLARKPQCREKKTLTLRKMKTIDHDAVVRDVCSSSLLSDRGSFADVTEITSRYRETLRRILDDHAPERCINVPERKDTSWMTPAILEEKRERQRRERTWRRTRLEVHRAQYVSQRNLVAEAVRKAKGNHLENLIEACGSDQKALFKIVNSLLKPKDEPISDASPTAEDFNEFFVSKIQKIHEALLTRANPEMQSHGTEATSQFSTFQSVTEEEVLQTLLHSPTKSCEVDPWPTWMLKRHATTLAPVITHIANISMAAGLFPEEWRHAIIRPLLKKPSLDQKQLKNYRPVANLPFLSKLIERVVALQLRSYLDENNLLPVYQSAYRTGHSVETALTRVQNDILLSLDAQQHVILVLLDQSAAFDTISHDILLQRLQHRFGLTCTVLKWIETYLTDRTQAVFVNGETSSTAPMQHGVPQGSVLGPLLFTMYTSPLVDIVSSHNLHMHLYADDTQIYVAFAPTDSNRAVASMERCLADVENWMAANFLKLNSEKTNLVYIRPTRAQEQEITLSIAGTAVQPSSTARNLGVIFNDTCSMKPQVKSVAQSCFYHLRNIARVRHLMSRSACERIVHALISARLDTCNVLLLNCPARDTDVLQRVQNAAARLVLRRQRMDSASAALRELHWLPIKERIIFKTCCLSFKAFHGAAPQYLVNLLHPYTPERPLRSEDARLLQQPRAQRHFAGDRAFAVAAPRHWNALPLRLKEETNYERFKKGLKTYLFNY